MTSQAEAATAALKRAFGRSALVQTFAVVVDELLPALRAAQRRKLFPRLQGVTVSANALADALAAAELSEKQRQPFDFDRLGPLLTATYDAVARFFAGLGEATGNQTLASQFRCLRSKVEPEQVATLTGLGKRQGERAEQYGEMLDELGL